MRRITLFGLILAAAVTLWRVGPSLRSDVDAILPTHTRHRLPDGTPRYTNRLAAERSPYLRQHAHNPVDWYPWGEEAFAKARRERKPVLLSIGYSTCHWCHVMAEESFEDETIAEILNARYVAVKVDREERPDVDAIYMDAVRAMTGGGGWPMTVWLTPERRPFYAGTYFPPRAGARGTKYGFTELLGRLAEAWERDPAEVEAAAADVVRRLAATPGAVADALPDTGVFTRAWAETAPAFDEAHGGFGERPKFPRPPQLLFLLRWHRRSGDPAALRMVVRTLDAMAAGGIRDHLAGGFHRYAVDAAWRLPHFEKMLYDNALLAVVYLEASQAAGRADLARVARSTLEYLARDMQAAGGGFFAASDADSDGEEGTYFTWSAADVTAAVGPEVAPFAVAYFDVDDERTTLATPAPLAEVSARLGLAPEGATARLAEARAALLRARATRVAPHVDRKVIVAWNGLAISAFARAAAVLGDATFAAVADRAADALLAARHRERLPRFLLDGRPHGDGYLDDYAFLVAGLLDLWEATFDPRWLREALALQRELDTRFADPQGGYFLTADDQETLLTRTKPDYDGAEPTGNSVALQNLLRLHELTGDDVHRARADALLRAFGGVLTSRPGALPQMLAGLDLRLARVQQVVLVSPVGPDALVPFREVVGRTFTPHAVLAGMLGGASAAATALVPLLEDKRPIDGRATAYVCEARTCKRPTTDPAELARQLAAGPST